MNHGMKSIRLKRIGRVHSIVVKNYTKELEQRLNNCGATYIEEVSLGLENYYRYHGGEVLINKNISIKQYFQDIKALTVYSMIILIIAPRSFSSNNHYKNIISQPMIIPLAAIYIRYDNCKKKAFGWGKFKNMRFLSAIPTSKLQMFNN